jgi:hypothetical protein
LKRTGKKKISAAVLNLVYKYLEIKRLFVRRLDKGYDETISIIWGGWIGKRVIVDNIIFWFVGVQLWSLGLLAGRC